MSKDLTPKDAGPIEKGLAESFDVHGRYVGCADRLLAIGKTQYPPEWISALIDHRQLAAIEQYLPFHENPSYAFAAGLKWQSERGFISAWKSAFDWRGVTATFEIGAKPAFPDLMQVHLPDIVEGQLLNDLINLGNLSKSSLSVYHRLISGVDYRPAMTGFSRFSNSLIASFSGVQRRVNEPYLSFQNTADVFVSTSFSVKTENTVWITGKHRDYEPITLAYHKMHSHMSTNDGTEINLKEIVKYDPDKDQPISLLPLQDNVKPGKSAVGVIEIRQTPIASIVTAKSKLTDIQTVFLADRKHLGDGRKLTDIMLAQPYSGPWVERLTKIPEPAFSFMFVEDVSNVSMASGFYTNWISYDHIPIRLAYDQLGSQTPKGSKTIITTTDSRLNQIYGSNPLSWLPLDSESPIGLLPEVLMAESAWPVAGVYTGRSELADLQSVFVAIGRKQGDTPKLTDFKLADFIFAPFYYQKTKIKSGFSSVLTLNSASKYSAMATLHIDDVSTPSQERVHVDIALSAFPKLEQDTNQPWSLLPWSYSVKFGELPAANMILSPTKQ